MKASKGMRTFAKASRATSQGVPAKSPLAGQACAVSRAEASAILRLHQVIGNRAVRSLMRDGRISCKAVSAASVEGHVRYASPGFPLAQDVRGFFEPRLRSDFGKVRVHHDGPADIRARRMGVVAFTNGRHIHFAAGHYQPWTTAGRWVLAHELAHVIQQGQSEPSPHSVRPSDDDHGW